MWKWLSLIFILHIYSLTCVFAQNNSLLGKGTTVLAVVTKDSIWLVADSRYTYTHYHKGLEDTSYCNLCKIRKEKNVFYVMINISTYDSKSFSFNAYDILKQIIDEDSDIENSIRKFDHALLPKFDSMCSLEKVHLRERINGGDSSGLVMGLIIISFKNNSPKIITRLYGLNVINDNKYEIIEDSTQKPFYDYCDRILKVGHRDSINSYLDINKDYFNDYKYMKNKLEYLIKIQGLKSPLDVGLPADIMVIYNNGFKWLNVKEECR